MNQLKVTNIDNRDFRTTVLTLDNGMTVEIDPVALFVNAVQNQEQEGPVFVEPSVMSDDGHNPALRLAFIFSTDEEHDEDNDTEIVDIPLENVPDIHIG